MNKVRIAQIGTSANSHGIYIFDSLKKLPDLFEIVGYALPENERNKFPNRMQVFEGYTEMSVEEILADPTITAVTIETEEIYLTKYAILAAKAGKHVHMEKPGGLSLPEFEELIAIMKQSGKVFHTGYMYRYNPYVLELVDRIKNGELGEILSVEAQMNCPHTVTVRKWLSTFGGGMMFFLGCHLIDLVMQLNGIPNKVTPFNKCTGTGAASKDFGFAVLEYDNGTSFVKVNANELGGFVRRQLVVTGTRGTVELKPFEVYAPGGQYTQKTEYTSTDWHDPGQTEKSDIFDRYDPMMTAFAQMVNGEKENPYTLDYELELYKTVLRCCGENV
ncbi:MAG: Gfo/Idh/MocA family oxidoreductase [Ruminococcaceae bacterium]|nr:Gfo/Idh/MocA family oxidoreductase [Oscillospiraceae bacterium]